MEDYLFWEYEDLIFSDSDVYDIMERVAGKYGWKRWKPANEYEAILFASQKIARVSIGVSLQEALLFV